MSGLVIVSTGLQRIVEHTPSNGSYQNQQTCKRDQLLLVFLDRITLGSDHSWTGALLDRITLGPDHLALQEILHASNQKYLHKVLPYLKSLYL